MSMKQIGAAVLNPGTTDETWGYCESTDIGHEGEKKRSPMAKAIPLACSIPTLGKEVQRYLYAVGRRRRPCDRG